MNSINALQKNAFNPLSFVSQRLPSNFHKITALVIAILALAVVRYAFRSLIAARVELNPKTPEEFVHFLKGTNYSSFLFPTRKIVTNYLTTEDIVKKIYDALQNPYYAVFSGKFILNKVDRAELTIIINAFNEKNTSSLSLKYHILNKTTSFEIIVSHKR